MNIGIFSGRIGRDAERRQLQGGEAVANFPLAVEIGTRDKPNTMWIDCSIWGKRAESLAPHLVKSLKVTVTGRVAVEEFEKKTGGTGYRLHVNVNDVDLHGQPSGSSSGGSAASANSKRGLDDNTPF